MITNFDIFLSLSIFPEITPFFPCQRGRKSVLFWAKEAVKTPKNQLSPLLRHIEPDKSALPSQTRAPSASFLASNDKQDLFFRY
jgi:hypothetical protein